MIKTYFVTAAAVIGLALVPATQALASPRVSHHDFAGLKHGKCFAFVPTKKKGPAPKLFTDDRVHLVKTPGGPKILNCHFDVPEWLQPDRALHASGFKCFIDYAVTHDSKLVVTPGGNANLICKINGKDKNDDHRRY